MNAGCVNRDRKLTTVVLAGSPQHTGRGRQAVLAEVHCILGDDYCTVYWVMTITLYTG